MYAHNDPLQSLAEWGLIGTLLLGSILLWPIVSGLRMKPRSRADRAVRAAGLLGLGVVYLHALVDFPLQVFAIQLTAGLWAAILIGAAGSSRPLTPSDQTPTTTTTERIEALRAEHRDLIPELDALRVLGAKLDPSQPETTDRLLAEVISTLRNDLLPHTRSEEAVLYPAVEQAMGAPGAMTTMVADHREIARRVEALATSAAAIENKPRSTRQLEDLRAQVLTLWAILLQHLANEEDILWPLLDSHLSVEEARARFDALPSRA
jgi:iron-sulfur cluster repair protein YtfE (RIC family)